MNQEIERQRPVREARELEAREFWVERNRELSELRNAIDGMFD